MDRIRIVGGRRLEGAIPISGAKNATLPLMIASLLTEEMLILDNVPRLADVVLLQRILSNHGVRSDSDFRREERHAAADDRKPPHRGDADPRQRAATGRRRAAAAHSQ